MASRRKPLERKAGTMHVVLRDYLDRLEAGEREKAPGERRYVPTAREIAKEVGINEVTLAKLMSGKIKSLNLDTGGKIMQTMRRFGFEMRESDLVIFIPETAE